MAVVDEKQEEKVEEVEETEVEETESKASDSEEKIDWKSMARKHEREARKARREREEFEARLRERESADQTDHEKAVAAAREEGERKAREESLKELRSDRLEVATTRLATKGVKVGEETVKFADPDDAIVHLERAIRRGDLDEDEVFDEKGKIQTEALATALAELLSSKPHLSATSQAGNRQRVGSADAGKGSGGPKDLEDLTVEEHLARIQKRK